jgi:glyoxylase-like metal-dependent hydrolase (beta-lactamase superfamily II)
MTAVSRATAGADALPDYARLPPSAFGPALSEQGYHLGRVERNLFWVTDGTYQSAFLLTDDGVVLFDAPPTIGHNLRRAVDEIASAEGAPNKVTHLVYSHHHADHAGAANPFGDDVIRIGHDTRRLLLRDNDPTRPAPDVTFQKHYTLDVGGERVQLVFHGPNHSPDNIFIHFRDHDALMLVDIVNSGWVPIFNLNLSEDVPGYLDAPGIALSYPWQHYIGGHLGRLGTRADIELHQQYIDDIVENSKDALGRGRPDAVLREIRAERMGGGEGIPQRRHRPRHQTGRGQGHRRAGLRRRRRVHLQHHVHDHAIDAPRPRRRLAGAPVTRIGLRQTADPLPDALHLDSCCEARERIGFIQLLRFQTRIEMETQ